MRKWPPTRLLGLLFIIVIATMTHADDESPSQTLLLALQVALCSTLRHQTVVQAISCPASPGASAVSFSLLPRRAPELSRWMMCSRHQHESKPRHDSAH